MNKFTKTLIKIVYYVFALAFGVILVLTLPFIILNSQLTAEMDEKLENGEFVDAMHLIGCYYDSEIAYYYEKDGVELVIFRATPFVDTVYETKDEQGNDISVTSQETLELGYFGFLYNVKDVYNVSSADESEGYENKTKLVINDDKEIILLDYDDSQDGKIDSILTLLNSSYLVFSITTKDVDAINKIEFIDKEGKNFLSVNISDSSTNVLDFKHDFFVEFAKFVPRYNELSKNKILNLLSEEQLMNEQKALEDIVTEIINNNPGYTVGTYAGSIGKAQTKSYLYSIIYFLFIFILGDILVGKRITIIIIKKIFKPLTKKMGKKKTEENSQELYDYYSQLVITLKVPADYEGIFKLILTRNEKEEIFELTKEQNFTTKRRIHAGIYVNIRFECEEYKVLNLPEQLEVKGFKTELNLELEKE